MSGGRGGGFDGVRGGPGYSGGLPPLGSVPVGIKRTGSSQDRARDPGYRRADQYGLADSYTLITTEKRRVHTPSECARRSLGWSARTRRSWKQHTTQAVSELSAVSREGLVFVAGVERARTWARVESKEGIYNGIGHNKYVYAYMGM